ESKVSGIETLKTAAFENRHKLAAAADLVIVSTSAEEYVLKEQDFAGLERKKETVIIDLSLPRNVDPALGKMPGLKVFDLDHLGRIVSKNLAERESLVCDAERIVFEMLECFKSWQQEQLSTATIVELRNKFETIRAEHCRKSRHSSSAEQLSKGLELFSSRLLKQILHEPTVQLKNTRDREAIEHQSRILRRLFKLD
ncbi:MAG: hypothetical protein K2X27_24595, partial [Candidatus Obscuribacterales bacterium]|nr:hypothetical protein [Candidatus Obscuribacterales bacterium]